MGIVLCVSIGFSSPQRRGEIKIRSLQVVGVTPMTEKNRSTAAFLAMLLGWLGAHKFYLGRPVSGVFYLLFFWSGIPGLLGFVEGVLYLVQGDQEFQTKYLATTAPKALAYEPQATYYGDPIDTLRRLESLRQEGLISDEEFEAKRRKLIDRIG
ncbi:MAG: NINE protein [Anaerolineae bacterium]|nr:NINE protein [Gloeobacterales cyanobacterium ES-bin-313]